jgi:hypothetical protein
MSEKPKEEAKRVLARSASFRVIYANSFRFRVSNNDVIVTLSVDTVGPDNEPLHMDEAQVAFTSTTAKLFLEALRMTITRHEERHGVIAITADKLSKIEQSIESKKS